MAPERGDARPAAAIYGGTPLLARDLATTFRKLVGVALRPLGIQSSEDALLQLLPPLLRVPDLLDQAAQVLAGNPLAARRLRELLGSFGGGNVPTGGAMRVLHTHGEGECTCGQGGSRKSAADSQAKTSSSGASVGAGPGGAVRQALGGAQAGARWAAGGSEGLLDAGRVEQLLAAVVYAARDAGELASMVGSIELGLEGLGEAETLLRLARSGASGPEIASAFGTATQVMGWIGTAPGVPATGAWRPVIPGIGPGARPGAGGGVPWFDWPVPGGGSRPGTTGTSGRPLQPPRFPRYEFEECLHFEIIPELHRRGIGFPELVLGSPTSYLIDSVEPEHACPGDTVVITGRNFDGTVSVSFVDDGGRTVSAAPTSVAPTRVTAVLPAQAASGPVWLYIPVTVRLCRSEQTLARPGTPGHLVSGRASIVSLGFDSGPCVTRGDPATLRWSAAPTDARVHITQTSPGAPSLLGEELPATGAMSLDTTASGVREYTVEAHNPHASCGNATATARLDVKRGSTPTIEILAVERTQCIQVFDLDDPDADGNNSIELIAGMDTVLRVFVRNTAPAPDTVARVTGVLVLDGTRYAPINGSPAGSSPVITAARNPLREETNHSLNFLVPAADARGTGRTARVVVYTVGDYCAQGEAVWEDVLSWADRPPLPVTIRRIADSDGSVVPEPEALELVRRAFRKMPSPATSIAMRPGVFQINAGTTEDNYCRDGGYYQLALSLAFEHNATEGYAPDPHESSWIGFYFQTGCDAAGMMAWPWTSTCISVRNATVAAHELMHTLSGDACAFACRLGHTVTGIEACEDIGQPVACHRLPGRPDGSLSDIPFDIDNNTTVTGARDLMSYRGGDNRWLNPELWVLGRELMNSRY